ncbi:MAG TPA: low-complexity protein, partial [Cyanobacteria bacterium UBA11148]|nr:low-complexity protein [Cyanobacteria bacterium UBA11148]
MKNKKAMKTSEVLSRYAVGQRDFRGVNLMGAQLKKANLSYANLSGADLRGA